MTTPDTMREAVAGAVDDALSELAWSIYSIDQKEVTATITDAVVAALSSPHGGEVTREKVARVIADELGQPFDDVHKDKREWIATGGMKGGSPRDVNGPLQIDYLSAADAALALLNRDPRP